MNLQILLIAATFSCLSFISCAKDRNSPTALASATAIQKSSLDESGCTRGVPEPLLASGSNFVRQSTQVAIETIPGVEGTSLTIRHYGCTHYALDFTFSWQQASVHGRSEALRAAANLLNTLKAAEANAPILKSVREGLLKFATDPSATSIFLSEIETLSLAIPSASMVVITYDVAL